MCKVFIQNASEGYGDIPANSIRYWNEFFKFKLFIKWDVLFKLCKYL